MILSILFDFNEEQNDLGESIIVHDDKIICVIESIIKVYGDDANVHYDNDKLFILLKRCYCFIKNDIHQNIFQNFMANKFIIFIEGIFNKYYSAPVESNLTPVESYTNEDYDFSKPEISKYVYSSEGEINYIKVAKTKRKI